MNRLSYLRKSTMENKRKIIDSLDSSVYLLSEENMWLLRDFNTGLSYPERGLGDYIKQKTDALHDMYSGDGVSYLVVRETFGHKEEVIAFFTLIASALPVAYKLRGCEEDLLGIPAVQISMFAIKDTYQDVFYQNKPVAAWIFENILDTINEKSIGDMGIKAIYLYSLGSAEEFYLRNGMNYMKEYMRPFVTNDDDCCFMYEFIRDVNITYEPDDVVGLNEAAVTSEQFNTESLNAF